MINTVEAPSRQHRNQIQISYTRHRLATDPPASTDESYQPDAAISSNYGELLKKQKYVLELNELGNITKEKVIYEMDCESSLDERLLLSSIVYHSTCPAHLLLHPYTFSDNIYAEIRKWRRTRVSRAQYFPTAFTPSDPPTEEDILQRNLGSFLVYLTETMDRASLLSNHKQSEIDYIVQNVSILMKLIFDSTSTLNIAWEKPSITNKDTNGKLLTHDFLIHTSHQEVGCGEIKVNEASKKLQEEDRARLGERLKRQLHSRILQAKSTREFFVFGVFISGPKMELYRSSFSKENGYDFVLLSNITLPTTDTTYTSLEESLEVLFSFKDSIINTTQNTSEYEQPYIYHEYSTLLKPTVSFI
ncbi:hypothetical protein G6F29_012264 [Rhizopus arrhizus]|nr:hypothetical protein G6F24_012216 [Rhizopus arrhizus]KAG0929397.1 hypothetical protein G6F30_012025 [Rhizopus arrhizus]KAG0974345.1 hypothetical protein G6F29_012264 [Rhizopus arrhizus]KAG1002263.1 hypothetical protein G6F27_012121 [Rhizopus arrhizus]KAG1017017.1 hypothetical protein G6F26_012067 [Rhizopus arrhizus]